MAYRQLRDHPCTTCGRSVTLLTITDDSLPEYAQAQPISHLIHTHLGTNQDYVDDDCNHPTVVGE